MFDKVLNGVDLGSIPVSSVLVGVCVFIGVNLVMRLQSRRRGETMNDENGERLKREKKRIAVCDAFNDVLLDLWSDNKITRDDYNYYCRSLGEHFGFADLLRRSNARALNPHLLKHKLYVLKKSLKQKRSSNGQDTSPPTVPTEVVSLSDRLRIIAGK